MNVAILDTETTGLPSAPWSRVVELAAVALDFEGRQVAEFDSLVLPDVLDERAARALKYNNITFDEVFEAPDTAQVRVSFSAWLLDNNVTGVMSYNEVFDRGMLERSGFRLPWAGCVMRLARQHMPPRSKDPSLDAACAYFGINHMHRHRALGDARAAAALYRGLVSF